MASVNPVVNRIATFAVAFVALAGTTFLSAQGAPRANGGWRIPENAAAEVSPLTVDDAVLAAGRRLFMSKCQRCHGPKGKGDGEDAEPMDQRYMDLTFGERAAENPDGVVFYKVWNGRSSPRMPTFSEEMSRQQVWTVVAFVQSLRVKPPAPAAP